MPDTTTQIAGATVMAPLVNALLVNPGLGAGEERLKASTEQILKVFRHVSDDAARRITPSGGSAHDRAALAADLAPFVAEAWKVNPEELCKEPGKVTDIYMTFVKLAEPRPETVFDPDFQRATDRSLAVASSSVHFLPLYQVLQGYSPAGRELFIGQNSVKKAVRNFQNDLESRAEQIATALNENGTESAWSQTFKTTLKVLSEAYGKAVTAEIIRMKEDFGKMNESERSAYKESLPQHPKGVLFTRVSVVMDKITAVLFPHVLTMDQAPQEGPSLDA